MTRPYDPLYYDPDAIADYGGYVPDRGYMPLPARSMRGGDFGRGRDFGGYGGGMGPTRESRYGGREPMGRGYGSPIGNLQTTTQVIK